MSVGRHAVTQQLHISLNGLHLGSLCVQTRTISFYAFTSWITRGRSCQKNKKNKCFQSHLKRKKKSVLSLKNALLQSTTRHSSDLNGCQRSGDIVFLWRHSSQAERTAARGLLRPMGMFIFMRGAPFRLRSFYFFPTEEVACQVSHVHSKKLTLVMGDRQEVKRSSSQKCSSEFLISASSPKQWSWEELFVLHTRFHSKLFHYLIGIYIK